MADYLVLEKWAGVVNRRLTRFAPGIVIDDARNDIAALLASGCALVPYDAASMGATLAAFLTQYGPGREELIGLSSMLEAFDSSPSAARLRERFLDMSEPNGWDSRATTTLAFDDLTRTFTLAPVGDSFDVWLGGSKMQFTSALTTVIPDVEGIHYIYIDADGTLTSTTLFSLDLFTQNVFVSIVYWDTSAAAHIYFSEERHGITMDGRTHYHLHESVGSIWLQGLALGDFSITGGAPTGAANAQFSCSDGYIADEDIENQIVDGSPQDLAPALKAPIYYRSGAGDWNRDAPGDFVVKYYPAASRLGWNQLVGGVWQQSDVGQNNYVLAHIFATNDVENPIISIQGQAIYANIVTARQGATTEINNLITFGLPFAEFTPLGTVIYQTNNGWAANAVRAKVVQIDTGDNYVDFRTFRLSSTGSVVEHGNLGGLINDDHLQYPLLAGRVGDRQVYPDDATTAPLNMTPRSAPPSVGNVNDIYLDDGTNTASGQRGFRICLSTGPDVWGDIPG
jgi:hypothetical protein